MFYLKNIELMNFRCYEMFSTNFNEKINIIVGNNAIGKTSLIEGVYFLGLCKSFRTNEDQDLIKRGKDFFYVKGNLQIDDKEYKIVTSLTEKGKKINVNDTIYKKTSDYFGFLNIICFSPADLNIVKGEPRIKRKFLDRSISQIDKVYLNNLIEYNKILKERNEILKNYDKYSLDMLKLYTSQLAKVGKLVIERRKAFICDIEPYIQSKIKEISSEESVTINYKPSVDEENIEKAMLDNIEKDILGKTTLIGPHRDDMSFILNDVDAETYGSQGQQRTIALSIKLGLAEYIKEKDEKMIIILDDVFGELDFVRQKKLLNVVDGDTQVFITTTTIDNIDKDILEKSNVIKLEEKVK